ncbi:unnamed protein product [Didymodactylos carnosus]|uniref:Uncharacterized protein n=1 Tax=Didymodactylos carnosus TaxID=1234261 RepID=A0A8S2E123_9BILA|nr:unnamed protein product [Didymodactylos carnosus]CAF3790292.1 unnamed protein product [Didymodactylos carnosus]
MEVYQEGSGQTEKKFNFDGGKIVYATEAAKHRPTGGVKSKGQSDYHYYLTKLHLFSDENGKDDEDKFVIIREEKGERMSDPRHAMKYCTS